MLESYHFQNTTKSLSITPYSNSMKHVITFGGLGMGSLCLPFFAQQNTYITYFLILLGLLMLCQAVYSYLNSKTVVIFNKEGRCIYEVFMGREKKIMTFDEAGIVRHTVNSTAMVFCLSKNKGTSRRYAVSHQYYVKKDAEMIALYQREILSEINYLIANS